MFFKAMLLGMCVYVKYLEFTIFFWILKIDVHGKENWCPTWGLSCDNSSKFFVSSCFLFKLWGYIQAVIVHNKKEIREEIAHVYLIIGFLE
jgi:hypothetical protein